MRNTIERANVQLGYVLIIMKHHISLHSEMICTVKYFTDIIILPTRTQTSTVFVTLMASLVSCCIKLYYISHWSKGVAETTLKLVLIHTYRHTYKYLNLWSLTTDIKEQFEPSIIPITHPLSFKRRILLFHFKSYSNSILCCRNYQAKKLNKYCIWFIH